MDYTAMIFYALVCGALSAAAPTLASRGSRILLGAGVGLIAAAILPAIRSAIGF